jgi:hypothetical protein
MRHVIAMSTLLLIAAHCEPARAVQCQHNIPPSNSDAVYQMHAGGTVTDNRTGLMWKRCSEGQAWNGSTCTGSASSFTWSAALALAEAASFAGFSDWRLPNHSELRSLVEVCAVGPSINQDIFPGTPPSDFWSGSPYADNASSAWNVYFGDGDSYDNPRDDSNYVRLVRAGQ